MIEATQTAQGFIGGRVSADLSKDKMLLFAVVRAIEIIGEAAARISPELKTSMPDIPWAAIVGMRNRVVHAYFSIDTEIVWNTVNAELPLLLPALQAAVDNP
nr:HepT-like ribonuclease domain-containing protein [uncultured Roseateles sp.]